MKVYLATQGVPEPVIDLFAGSDMLYTFPYLRKLPIVIKEIPKMRNFILDSGVFTMINSGKRFNIEEYAKEYADFVREHNIKQYVELDVDQLYGVEYTRKLRDKIEARVGWKSIPVWHTIRGKESFIQDCKDYSYIALGFFLTEGLPPKLTDKYAKAFVDLAHRYNCRIHGLGYTKMDMLPTIPFDSVDSSSWTMATRYGQRFRYNENTHKIESVHKPEGYRINNFGALSRSSFVEWKKFQDYAYYNLPNIWQ